MADRRLIAGLALMAALVAAQPRLHLAFEDRGDPRPRQMALTGEVVGLVLGVVISWSQRGAPQSAQPAIR
jgi:hypothetical protein